MKKLIIIISITIITILIIIYVIFNLNKNNYIKTITNEGTVEYSTESSTSYNPPSDVLGKSLKEVENHINKYINKYSNLKLDEVNDEVVTISNSKLKNKLFFIEYSETYDCTTIKESLSDEIPIKILYHFEYKTEELFSNDLLSFINEYTNDNAGIHINQIENDINNY